MPQTRGRRIIGIQDRHEVLGSNCSKAKSLKTDVLIVRAVGNWNMLPRKVVVSPSLEIFKKKLDQLLSGTFQE